MAAACPLEVVRINEVGQLSDAQDQAVGAAPDKVFD
jgi:hypothetical protein